MTDVLLTPLTEAKFWIKNRAEHGGSIDERDKTAFWHLQRVVDFAEIALNKIKSLETEKSALPNTVCQPTIAINNHNEEIQCPKPQKP
jgi:hypothetical protein